MERGEINCVSWNVMAPVPAPLRFSGQSERMQRIPNALIEQIDPIHPVDVCVVQESIVPDLHNELRQGMRRAGFLYETKQLQGSIMDFKLVQGGLVLFSRHPIVYQDGHIFGGECTKEDCLAAKGVVYAVVQKGVHRYHVFAIHLNSWESPQSRFVRRGQMAEVRKFIDRQRIGVDEPVLMMGDMNVDLYDQQKQLLALCDVVQMNLLPRHGQTHSFSSDPQTNQLVGMDDSSAYSSDAFPGGCERDYMKSLQCVCCPQEWLDYALVSNRHASLDRSSSWMRVYPIKSAPFVVNLGIAVMREISDLSDHYPLLSHYEFYDVPVSEKVPESITPETYHNQVTQVDAHPSGLKIESVLLFMTVGIVGVIGLIVLCVLLKKWMNERAT